MLSLAPPHCAGPSKPLMAGCSCEVNIERHCVDAHSTDFAEPARAMLRCRLNSTHLAAECRPREASYRLLATVTHHGSQPGSGHYTADVRQPGGDWLRFDDDKVSRVNFRSVIGEKVYLLFYQLTDKDSP